MYVIKSMVEYAPKWIQMGWVRMSGNKSYPISNLDLIQQLYILTKTYPVEYIHVKSHKKEPINKKTLEWKIWKGNYMADKYAKNAVESI